MNKYKVSSMLINKDAVWSTAWSLIQQMVVAISTYLIVQSIKSITSGELQTGFMYVAGFTLSLILVYIPNVFSMAYLQKWRLSSIENFVKLFILQNKGKTSFGHARNKAKLESWLTNESFTVFENATGLLYQIFSTLMNSVFNILMISLLIDSRILFWYLLAGAVLVASNYLFRNKISTSSSAVQKSRNDLSRSMLSAWQNIFIGNQHNFSNWDLQYSRHMTEARSAASSYDITRSLISSATASLALLIVAFGNSVYLSENISNVPALAALFITLPRQLQIIQSIFAFFGLVLSWNGVHEQLKALRLALSSSEAAADSARYINFNKIVTFDGSESHVLPDVQDFWQKINLARSGRWTLRGENGAGKSTLLSLLKERSGECGFLLPTNYEDLSFEEDFIGNSDGNRLLKVFKTISSLNDVKVIILDEWDANLDGVNLRRIDEAIEELAATKVVIESRHCA